MSEHGLDVKRIAEAWRSIDEIMARHEPRWFERKAAAGPGGFGVFGQGVDDEPFFVQSGVYMTLLDWPPFGQVVLEVSGDYKRIIGEDGPLAFGLPGPPPSPGLN